MFEEKVSKLAEVLRRTHGLSRTDALEKARSIVETEQRIMNREEQQKLDIEKKEVMESSEQDNDEIFLSED